MPMVNGAPLVGARLRRRRGPGQFASPHGAGYIFRGPVRQAGTALVTSITGSLTVAWPTHQTDDIGLLLVETQNGDVVTLSTPAGFIEVPGSPQGNGTPADGTTTALRIYWCRATSGAMASPVVSDPGGDHILGQIATFRGCIKVGEPWSAIAYDSHAAIGLGFNVPGATTIDDRCLIFLVGTNNRDTGTYQSNDDWSNVTIQNLRPWFGANSVVGLGGGIYGATAEQELHGVYGISSATYLNNMRQAHFSIALKPQQGDNTPYIYTWTLLSSITPVGSIIKEIDKVLTSIITPAGTLIKGIWKVFTSTITPAGSIAVSRVINKVFTSTITPAGTLIKQVQKQLNSTITPAGTLVKQINKIFASTITPAGTLAKQIQKTFTSSITPAGTLVRQINKALTSIITPAGSLIKQVNKTLNSAITPAGTLVKQVQKLLTGSITPAGTIKKQINKPLTSSITPSGTLAKQLNKTFSSSITPSGTLRRQINKMFTSAITPAGTISVVRIPGLIVSLLRTVWALLRPRNLITEPNAVTAIFRDRNLEVDLTMPTLQQFPDKGTGEKLSYTVDFVNELAAGELLINPSVVIQVSTDSLVADSNPSDVYTPASAAIQGTKVGMKLRNGVNGCLYLVIAKSDTDQGQQFESRALLLVKDATE